MTILAKQTTSRSPFRPLTAYGLIIVAGIAVFWNVKHLGDRWYPDAVGTAAVAVGGNSHATSPLAHVLLAIASLILLGRFLGVLLRSERKNTSAPPPLPPQSPGPPPLPPGS